MPDIETLRYWRELAMVIYYPVAIVSMTFVGLASCEVWMKIQ